MKILRCLLVLALPFLIQCIPLFEQMSAIVGRNIESMSPMGIATWASLQGKSQQPEQLQIHDEPQTAENTIFPANIAPLGLRAWASLQAKNSRNN